MLWVPYHEMVRPARFQNPHKLTEALSVTEESSSILFITKINLLISLISEMT